MTNLKRLTLATLFALSAISLLAGCGDPTGTGEQTPSCSIAKDCKDGELCTNLNGDNKGFCEKKCTPGQANACETGMTCTTFYEIDSNTKKKIEVGSACLKKCTTDEECGTGKICGVTKKGDTEKSCLVRACTADKDCLTGYKCDTTTKSCVAKATTQNPADDKTCTAQNVGTKCGPDAAWACVSGKCEGRPVRMIVIKDLSTPGTTDGTCKGADKGADILGVGLVKKGEAAPYAWARNAKRFTENAADNPTGAYASTTDPDGNPPNWTSTATGECQVKGKLSASGKKFAATGCGGYLFMPVEYGSGSMLSAGTVNVYEFDGATCNGSSDPADHYAVYACNTDEFTGTGDKNVGDYAGVENYLTRFCIQLSDNNEGNSQSTYPPSNP